jgi:FAD binding domain
MIRNEVPDGGPVGTAGLVAGAGPVGLVAAAELACRGTPVRIIDKLTSPATESRAIVVPARSLEMLDRMGAQRGAASGRQRAGRSFHGERFLVGDVEAEHHLDQHSMYTYFAPHDGPLLVFPMQGQRMRLIAQIDASGSAPEPPVAWLQQVTDERAGSIQITSARWLTIFGGPPRLGTGLPARPGLPGRRRRARAQPGRRPGRLGKPGRRPATRASAG